MIKINQRISDLSSEIAKMNQKDASRVLDEAYTKIAEIKKIQLKKNNFPGLEKQNFRIDSSGWEVCKSGGIFSTRNYLENPEEDIIEFMRGKEKGEQLFTWSAAMRETEKAGKVIPSRREWGLIESSPDLIKFNGRYCSDSSGFNLQSFAACYWTSSRDSGDDLSIEISYLKRSFGRKIRKNGKEIWRELGMNMGYHSYFLSVRCFAGE